jgi:hypothetical protein
MDPLERGVVLAPEPGGPGGGVVGAVGDQGPGREAFAGPGVFGLEGRPSQALERLPPRLALDADHKDDLPGGPESPRSSQILEVTERIVLRKLPASGGFRFNWFIRQVS